MKTLPKYYVIKRDGKDPRWRQYVDFINRHINRPYFSYTWNYIGYDGSMWHNGFEAWDSLRAFKNSPTLITLDDWEEATQNNTLMSDDTIDEIESYEAYCNSKTQRKRHTYNTTYVREDGISFTADSIDGKKIADLEDEEKEHYKQARAIRALLNAHRNLKF